MDGDRSSSIGTPPSDDNCSLRSSATAATTTTKMSSSTQLRANKKSSSGSMGSYRDMSYREKPATPNSPSGTTVTTMYDHLLSPPSPQEEEETNDRLRNDLLDEICNDMGVDDSMDLDLDDFVYQGQQGQQKLSTAAAAMQQRFGQIVTPNKQVVEGSDGRRGSVTTTASSGYATSDSLCAIAKLTQSISNEGQAQPGSSDTEGRPRESPESMKQDPVVESEPECGVGGVNDTDQGKAASKIALQKQMMSESAVPDRKRSATSNESSHETPNQRPPVIDYSSYQDDYAMEDMTAPDTMINFSEMPQQPNYYQCPQTAHDNLNLGFNMSLQQQQVPYPPHSAHHHNSSQFGQMGYGGLPQQHHHGDASMMGRSSPQPRVAHNPFQTSTAAAAGHPPHTLFASCQQSSGPSSLQSTASSSIASHGFQRSESFPGATTPFHAAGSTPAAPGPQAANQQASGSAPSQHASALHQSPPQTPGQQKQASQQGQSTPSSRGSTPAAAAAVAGTSSSAASSQNINTSQQGFMQRLVTDKSSAFRSHPLFPLLRDLIIADMNFHEPSFPHSLIKDLPIDFNKLLSNYLSRNPGKKIYQSNQSVESVVMDALKYAHHTLIEKIQHKKLTQPHELPAGIDAAAASRRPAAASTSTGAQSQSMTHMPMSNVNEYCEKFEDSVRQSMPPQVKYEPAAAYGTRGPMSQQASPVGAFRPTRIREPGPLYNGDMGPSGTYNPLSVETGCPSPSSSRTTNPMVTTPSSTPPNPMYGGQSGPPPPQYHPHAGVPLGYGRSPQQPGNQRNPYMNQHGGPSMPPPNYTVSPNNPPLSRHQQPMYDMGPPPTAGPTAMYSDPNSHLYGGDMYGMHPPTAHHHRLHMGLPDNKQLMYMNNINDPSLVRQMMDDGKVMYDSMSDNVSVMSGHSMQGSVKGAPPGQKPTEGRKHASLPKEAVNIMLNWLREHQDKPYPNDDEKGMLIKQTGLSITQINYWFTNARRRLLPKWRGEDM